MYIYTYVSITFYNSLYSLYLHLSNVLTVHVFRLIFLHQGKSSNRSAGPCALQVFRLCRAPLVATVERWPRWRFLKGKYRKPWWHPHEHMELSGSKKTLKNQANEGWFLLFTPRIFRLNEVPDGPSWKILLLVKADQQLSSDEEGRPKSRGPPGPSFSIPFHLSPEPWAQCHQWLSVFGHCTMPTVPSDRSSNHGQLIITGHILRFSPFQYDLLGMTHVECHHHHELGIIRRSNWLPVGFLVRNIELL